MEYRVTTVHDTQCLVSNQITGHVKKQESVTETPGGRIVSRKQNRIKNPKVSSHLHALLIIDKVAKIIQWGRDSLLNKRN